MTPKFANSQDWQQANLLMQPAFIRVIDNIRKQLETSDWHGSYDNQLLWPEDTSDETKAHVLQLQEQLKQASSPDAIAAVEQQLADLPEPFPQYALCLKHGDQEQRIDLWQLCYRVCFAEYDPEQIDDPNAEQTVVIDESLIDTEIGDVDWVALDHKAKAVISNVFEDL
ncbi:MAG: hypothetical protein ACTS2F_02245 [Thainema sp.]